MRWFLRAVWDGTRSWGVGFALGSMIYHLLFARNPPAWPTPALYEYAFKAVFVGAVVGLYQAWRASAEARSADGRPRG